MDIAKLCERAHANSANHGFWNAYHQLELGLPAERSEIFTWFKLARFGLIASEVGEAVEAVRKNDSENLAEELADICIRCFDYAGGFGIDLEAAILAKMKKNESRPHMHGKNS